MTEYPIILHAGDRILISYAKEYRVLPMAPSEGVALAVLPEQRGSMRAGLYSINGGVWSYVVPYKELNVSKFVDKVIEVYCNVSSEKILASEFIGTVYMNGGESASRNIPAGDSNYWAVVSFRANPAESSESQYVLPRATATTLGGVQVPPSSGLEIYNGFLSVIKPNPSYQIHLPAQTTIGEAAGGMRYEWLIDVGAARLSSLDDCVFTTKTPTEQPVYFAVTKNGVPIYSVEFRPGELEGFKIPDPFRPPTGFFRNDVLGFWQNGSTQKMASMNVLITLERLG